MRCAQSPWADVGSGFLCRSFDVVGHHLVDGLLDDCVGFVECFADPNDIRVGDQCDDAGMSGSDCVLQLSRQFAAMVELANFAGGGSGDSEGDSAAEDRWWKDHPECHATDDTPFQVVSRAVIGDLLDFQGAVCLALDHDDTFDLQGAAVLNRFQGLVCVPGRGRIGEVGNEQRVGAISDRCGSRHDFGRLLVALVFGHWISWSFANRGESEG